jgi:hypothetical protein
MTSHLFELDARRSSHNQVATDLRRHARKSDVVEREARDAQRATLDGHLCAEPAQTWGEAAAKARYLILLYAETQEGHDPEQRKLVRRVLSDLARLNHNEGVVS